MENKGWNKYWWRSLPRSERARIVLASVRGESPLIQQITRTALDTDPLDAPREFDKEDSEFEF